MKLNERKLVNFLEMSYTERLSVRLSDQIE